MSPATVLYVLGVTGLVLVVAFEKTNWSIGPSLSGYIHRYASLVAFVALPLGVLLIARRLQARWAVLLGAGTLGWLVAILAGIPVGPLVGRSWWQVLPLGLMERGLAVTLVAGGRGSGRVGGAAGACDDHRMTRRALVLGGGGITGIAWMWGILSGLAEAGVDLRDADLVIGTSAGSLVGASVAAGLDPEERYRAQLAAPDGETGAAVGVRAMLRLATAVLGPPAPQRFRARIGRVALRTPTGPEADRVAVIENGLPVREWPQRALQVTAVDAASGEFRAFDRDDGVPLARAVAASCAVPAVWPPVTALGRRWIDGGVRSPANADLAAGYERVVVLAPLVRGFGTGTGVDAQVAVLRARARVAMVSPDVAALAAIGRNVLDPAKRAAAARAGREQAASVVPDVTSVWSR